LEFVMRRIAAFVLAGLTVCPALAAGQAGFRHYQMPSLPQGRGLDVAIWYPTAATGAPTVIGENAVFFGQSVQVDAPVAAGQHRLIVLSHGYGGTWSNLGWLAVELARLGYVVAAPNHPGTTAQHMEPVVGAQLWERPRDITRLIDALTHDPGWSGVVSKGGVAAIGHSLGGWTVAELAGGRFDPDRFNADCKDHGGLASCQSYRDLGVGKDATSREVLADSYKDPRIKAIVSLDLGLARGLDPGSLASIKVPVLVIAAGAALPERFPQIPADLESRVFAGRLPPATTQYIEIAGATHFSFVRTCKPGAAELLARESAGDVVACLDGDGADRDAIHRQTATEILRFLTATLPPDR
jgi:predicted dienelactone hydrolase